MTQTAHEPTHPRPEPGDLGRALRVLAAAIAWEEWDSEPERVFDDAEAVSEYRESLLDLAHDREQGEAEIADLALGLLGLTEQSE